ncbi:hypothetical protein K3495_g5028 [Podosphaera aphanis]|nr:hypothetical protein K3495_g5028 [Podosphaera aphanis]
MERNDGIVRWSPNPSHKEFIKINLSNQVIDFYQATGHAHPEKFDHLKSSRHSNFPKISGYDWSPVVRGLVTVGTSEGEVFLLRVDDNSNASLTLPLKTQRACQAVAFNTTGLLAIGLDRVRNDSCLQIWDVNERLGNWDTSKPGWSVPAMSLGPKKKLEGSMSVTSIRFFEDSPQTLIFGVRNQAVKIYDLRDPNFTAITFKTRCNNNIALDYIDTNYFASSTLDLPGLVVFDKRAGGERSNVSSKYVEAFEEEKLPWGAVLKLDHIIDGDKSVSVKQLRFSREHSGALGVLSTSGQLQILQVRKEYTEDESSKDAPVGPELLEIKKSYEIERSYSNPVSKRKFEQRIVSFDWLHLGTLDIEARIIGLQANGEFAILRMPSRTGAHLLQVVPWAKPHRSDDSHLSLPYFKDFKRRCEVLGPLYASVVKANVPVFGPDRYATAKTKASLVSKIQFAIKTSDNQAVNVNKIMDLPHDESSPIDLVLSGYLFDCQKNREISRNKPHLEDLWEWIYGAEEAAKDDGMVAGSLDLSFLGVYYIWTNQLGAKSQSRLINTTIIPSSNQWEYYIASINKKNGRPNFDSVQTVKPHHRQLCLAITGGIRTDDETFKEIDTLVSAGNYAPAACLALFEGHPKLAIKILKDGGNKYLFMAMALDIKIKTNASLLLPESEWIEALNGNQGLADDPYVRAIFHYIATGSWEAIAEEKHLPLRQRVALALRNFTDEKLTEWLEKMIREVIKCGDLQGIVLAGITDPTISIMAKYVERSGDYQTAILAISFSYPRYLGDMRCDLWREEYRAYLNRHKRFIDRVKFDQESIRKSRNRDGVSIRKPSPRQVTVRCLNCDKMTANNSANPIPDIPLTSKLAGNSATVAGINAGLRCPRCGVGLPRCIVCMHHVLDQARCERPELSNDLAMSKTAANFPSFCMKCKHVMHMEHALLWFRKHDECPVPECHCRCNDMASR